MKILDIEIVKNTDKKLILHSDNLDLSAMEFYCDLTLDNIKTAAFVFTPIDTHNVVMFIDRDTTKDLSLGIHKGNLLIQDTQGLISSPREIHAKVSINRTEML
jgi:hypothetical protein